MCPPVPLTGCVPLPGALLAAVVIVEGGVLAVVESSLEEIVQLLSPLSVVDVELIADAAVVIITVVLVVVVEVADVVSLEVEIATFGDDIL